MKEIYNEGRVVGLSAYEIYVRHSLSEFPDEPIMSEREWLAATLGDGVSMILHIAKDTPAGVHDFQLPVKSKLCAAKTITASMFNGEVELSGYWATSVTSYSTLLDNPKDQKQGQNLDEPTSGELSTWDANKLHMFREYMKVVDGVAFQPRLWEEVYYTAEGKKVTQAIPADKYLPDLSQPGTVRIRLAEPITEDLNILLSGFFHRPIIAGVSMFDSNPLDSPKPENGDFLGVEIYPWASKVVFTVPSEAYYNVNMKPYERELPDGKNRKYISQKPIVDYDSNDPNEYYKSKHSNSCIPLDVKDMNVIGSGVSVIGTYQRVDRPSAGYTGTNYPPALYGSRVTSTGVQKMSPIDIVAPGSIKMFEDKDLAINYPKVYPNIYALHETQSGDVYIMKESSTNENIVPITTKVKVENFGNSNSPKYAVTTQARGAGTATSAASISAVSLLDMSGNRLNTEGSSGTLDSTDFVNWTTLLQSLGVNKKIELLGSNLKEFRSHLPNIQSGVNGVLKILGTGASSIAGSLSVGAGTTIGGNLTVNGTGASKIGGTLSVVSNASVGGTLSVTSNSTIGGNLTVNGTGASRIGGTLSVGYSTTIGGDLTVNGTETSSFSGRINVGKSVTVGSTLHVNSTSDSEIKGDLIVGSGRSSGPNLTVNHGAAVGTHLFVGDMIHLQAYDSGTFNTKKVGPKLWYSSGSRKDPKDPNRTLNYQLIASGVGLKSGKKFIEFKQSNDDDADDTNDNSIRLYVSNTQPSTDNVPIGSIGIGW